MTLEFRMGIGNREEQTFLSNHDYSIRGDKLKRDGWTRDPKPHRGDVLATRRYFRPRAPTLFDVLYCVVSDAQSYDNSRDFAEWESELGFSEDSREAERIYRLTAEQSKSLRRVAGAEHDTLVAMDEDRLRDWCDEQEGKSWLECEVCGGRPYDKEPHQEGERCSRYGCKENEQATLVLRGAEGAPQA